MPSGLVTDTENRQSLQDSHGVGPWCLTEGIASTVTVKKSLPSASLRRRETFVRSSTSLGLRSTWSSRWSHRNPLRSHGTSERFVRLGVKQLHCVSHPVGIVQVSISMVFVWSLPWLRSRGNGWLDGGFERSQRRLYSCLRRVWKTANIEGGEFDRRAGTLVSCPIR